MSKVGLDKKVKISHSNNHGSQSLRKKEVMSLFKGMDKHVIERLVEELRPDFEICGYEETLSWILELL